MNVKILGWSLSHNELYINLSHYHSICSHVNLAPVEIVDLLILKILVQFLLYQTWLDVTYGTYTLIKKVYLTCALRDIQRIK